MKRTLIATALAAIVLLSAADLGARPRRRDVPRNRRGSHIVVRRPMARPYLRPDRRFTLSERRIVREIRRNQRRIERLERRVDRLLQRRHARREIRRLEREIRALHLRNAYLRRLLF